MIPQWGNVPQWEEIPESNQEPKKTADTEEKLLPGIPESFLETEPKIEQVLIPKKKRRGRPKKGKSKHKSESVLAEPINPRALLEQKINKRAEKARRDQHRYRIQAITEDDVKLYYVDHIVFWSLNKSKSLQIYGKQYAEELARRLSKEPPRYKMARKFKEIKAKLVSKKDVDERFFMENVYENDAHFKRGFMKEAKARAQLHKKNRLKDLKDGNYKTLTARDEQMLKEDAAKRKRTNMQRTNLTNMRRDRRRIRTDYEEPD